MHGTDPHDEIAYWRERAKAAEKQLEAVRHELGNERQVSADLLALKDEDLTNLYATAMEVIRRNASSKWGHPKYTASATSQQLRTLCDGAVMLVRAIRDCTRQGDNTSSRSLPSIEDIDMLIQLRNEMHNAERRSPDIMYYPAHRIKQREALERLLRQTRSAKP